MIEKIIHEMGPRLSLTMCLLMPKHRHLQAECWLNRNFQQFIHCLYSILFSSANWPKVNKDKMLNLISY